MKVFLPTSEEAFSEGLEEQRITLQQALRQKEVLRSSLAARVLVSHLLHQALVLAQESTASLFEEDLDANQYWSRLRQLDNDLTSIFLKLPESLQLPGAFRCQHAVFLNIMAHVAIICLHQSAMKRAQNEAKNSDHLEPISSEPETNPSVVATIVRQRDRMLAAAKEIQHIFGIVQDLEMALKNPMQDFAAYTAALVFLERLAADHGDAESRSSVTFLLDVLNIAGQTNPSAQVFAARLTADLERCSVSVASSASN